MEDGEALKSCDEQVMRRWRSDDEKRAHKKAVPGKDGFEWGW